MIIEETIQNDDETFIVSDQGSVVMVSQAYWEEIQETLRLLDDQKSLLALLQGQQARKAGRPMTTKTMADVFYDLQN
ncbi:MAG: hypothetical protein ACPGWR_13795 [Ardenticatenaceae bacterium]